MVGQMFKHGIFTVCSVVDRGTDDCPNNNNTRVPWTNFIPKFSRIKQAKRMESFWNFIRYVWTTVFQWPLLNNLTKSILINLAKVNTNLIRNDKFLFIFWNNIFVLSEPNCIRWVTMYTLKEHQIILTFSTGSKNSDYIWV